MTERYQSPAGPEFISHPLEKHVFEPQAFDSEFCEICGRMRSFHINDGFEPNHEKPKCSMDRRIKYNKHDKFFTPGKVSPDEFGDKFKHLGGE
jgi:hypothetical protein